MGAKRFKLLSIIVLGISFDVVGVKHLNKKTKFVYILNTIPKCGTHLAKKSLWFMTGRKLGYSHYWPEQAIVQDFSKPNVRVIFMMRDPRDMLVSYVKWIFSGPDNFLIGYNKNFDDMFEYILVNGFIEYHNKEIKDFLTRGPCTFGERYKQYLDGWKTCPTILIIRFEDLVGAQGGGSDEVQKQVLLEIGRHLEFELSDQDIRFIQKRLFGGTPTFREGLIGGWKKHFTPERKALFKKYFPTEYLIELGYETSYDW